VLERKKKKKNYQTTHRGPNKMFVWIIVLGLLQEPVKKWPEWECVRWKWTGDVYERRVICLEWRKRENRWIP
jgi:hypothetical protein